ncbi:hypothetical protein Droror1_Dr00004462 [Drosera rotundifolia]
MSLRCAIIEFIYQDSHNQAGIAHCVGLIAPGVSCMLEPDMSCLSCYKFRTYKVSAYFGRYVIPELLWFTFLISWVLLQSYKYFFVDDQIIEKPVGCGGSGNTLCTECGGRGHL